MEAIPRDRGPRCFSGDLLSRTIPVGVPAEAVAGDTLEFDYSHSDFPVADGWTPTLILRGNHDFTSQAGHVTTDGNLYKFKVPAADFVIAEGSYRWAMYFTKDADRVTADRGTISVAANPTIAVNQKSFAERMLEIVEARLEGRLIADIESYSIGGRSVSKMSFAELRAYRVQLYAEIASERGVITDTEIAFVCP